MIRTAIVNALLALAAVIAAFAAVLWMYSPAAA